MTPNRLLSFRRLLVIPGLLSLFGCGSSNGGGMKPTCTYAVAPQTQLEIPNQQNSQMAQNQAANFRYTLTTGSTCTWTTNSNQPWLRFANASGTGGATISLTWDANGTGTDRTASVTIGDQTRAVLQHQPNWNGFP